MKIKIKNKTNSNHMKEIGSLDVGDCFYFEDCGKNPQTIAMKVESKSVDANAVYLDNGQLVKLRDYFCVIPVKVKMTVK